MDYSVNINMFVATTTSKLRVNANPHLAVGYVTGCELLCGGGYHHRVCVYHSRSISESHSLEPCSVLRLSVVSPANPFQFLLFAKLLKLMYISPFTLAGIRA